jgi:N-acetylmuramoyl-L-alanine amidase
MVNSANPHCFFHRTSRVVAYFVFILMIFHALSASAGAAATRITGARIGGDAQATRFVLDVTAPVLFDPSLTRDPPQLRLKFPSLGFDLPAGAGQKALGLVSRFRYGATPDGGSEVLIDLTGPARIASTSSIGRKNGKPARIVIDLVPDVVAAPISATAVTPLSHRFHIVIDPGHGGIDPGAVSPNRTMEKDVVMAFSAELKRQLEAQGSFEVTMTRDTDSFISLSDRVSKARMASADLLIAIHADTLRGKFARGITLYTLSDKASDAEAAALALKENRADIIAGIDLGQESSGVADLLIDLAQRESKTYALRFAHRALQELKPVTLMTGQPIRSAGFVVLKAPDVPSVLMELGYLSNADDEKLLQSQDWQATTAAAMVRAIAAHFKDFDGAATGSIK